MPIILLLNYSKNNGTQRLLYISSSEVYGNKKTVESFMEGDYGEVDIDNIKVVYKHIRKDGTKESFEFHKTKVSKDS